MKRILLVSLLVNVLLIPQSCFAEQEDCEPLTKAFIEAMLDKMGKAVSTYGTNRLWYRGMEEILEIERPNPRNLTHFIVTVRVKTFEGAHNPPYAYETMKINLPDGEVVKYDIKWLERKKHISN